MTTRRNNDIPFPRQPQQNQVRIDLSKAESITCDSCGGIAFDSVILLRRISPILSPDGKEGIIPIQTFACHGCGFINEEFLPAMNNEEKE